jgi:hypothetical protein
MFLCWLIVADVWPFRNARDAHQSNFFGLLALVLAQQPNLGTLLSCKSLAGTLLDCALACGVYQPLYGAAWNMLCWLPTFAAGPVWFLETFVEVTLAYGTCVGMIIGHYCIDSVVCSRLLLSFDRNQSSSEHSSLSVTCLML